MLQKTFSKKRKAYELLMKSLMYLSLCLTVSIVLFLIIYVLTQGSLILEVDTIRTSC